MFAATIFFSLYSVPQLRYAGAMRFPFRFALPFRQERLVAGAAVLAVTQLGASLAGLVRDRVLAGTFPGLRVVDVYIAAFRPSDLLFQVTIMAGFSVALVPLLSQYHSRGDRAEMGRLLGGAVGIAAAVFGVVALALFFAFPQLASLFVQFDGETMALYITFGRLALLTNFLFIFGNAFGQYLITIQRYWVYGITPILYTLGTISGTLFLSGPDAFGIMGPMYGTLGGAVVYVLLRLAGVVFSGCRFGVRLWHPDLPECFRLMLPRMLALGALQLQLLLFDRIASGLPAGSVTINAYARNFQAVAVGIVGIALAQSAFPLLSQAIARQEPWRFWMYLRKGVAVLLLLTLPGALILGMLAPVAARLVNIQHVLPVFQLCLILYAISIPFESINHLLLRSFYALKHTATPAVFSVLNGAIAIALSWYLAPQFGVYALALGFSAGQVVELLGLASILPHQVHATFERTNWLKKLINRFVH